MKIAYNWIKQFLKIDLPYDQVSEMLTDLGLEVEGVNKFESVRGSLKGVIVGEVLSCNQHPNADRLKVTQVDLGSEKVQIVCGALNVAKGQKVAVATVGTELYGQNGDAFQIKKSKIRGEESFGMICAEDELGLGASHDGIMVLDEILKNGTPCDEVFDVAVDQVFEIGLTPNRADAMSHMGVARDLKALCQFKEIKHQWSIPGVENFKIENSADSFSVTVEAPDKSPRYMGVTITDLTVAPSPTWLQNRLKSLGLTPKNNIVDITNYILHDLGQPLHAFDLSKIEKGIIVKTVEQNTPFVTLDGEKRKLDAEDLMICDHKKPLCIAGVFGGIDSGVSETTTSIFLESAYFDPVSVRKSAKRHGLNTDASFRFERGVDPDLTEYALKHAANMIVELAGGIIKGELHEHSVELPEAPKFMLNHDDINKTVGQEISKEDVSKILNGLEINIEHSNEDGLLIEIPRYRVDVTRPADVMEEILRVYGYNNIEISSSLQSNLPLYEALDHHQIGERLSNQLVGLGFNEMINNSITTPQYSELTANLKAKKGVNIINPLGKELSQMRGSILPSALEVVKYNINRQSKNLKLFELGKTYEELNGSYEESKYLSLVVTGNVYNENWNVDNQPGIFFYFKGVINQLLEKSTQLKWEEKSTVLDIFSEGLSYGINKQPLIEFGFIKKQLLKAFDIDQEVLYAEIDFNALADIAKNNDVKFKEIPKFPNSKRDFALLLDTSVQFDSVKKIAFKTEKNILSIVELFDVYEGDKLPKGKKSYGVSFYFQDPKKTLTDKYVDKIMGKLQQQFESQLGAQLR